MNSVDSTAYKFKNEMSNFSIYNEALVNKLSMLEEEFSFLGKRLEHEEIPIVTREGHKTTKKTKPKEKLKTIVDKNASNLESVHVTERDREQSSERIKIAVSSLPEREIKMLNKMQTKQLELENRLDIMDKNNIQEELREEIKRLENKLERKVETEEINGVKKAINILRLNVVENLENLNILKDNYNFSEDIVQIRERLDLMSVRIKAVAEKKPGEAIMMDLGSDVKFVYQQVFDNLSKEVLVKHQYLLNELSIMKSIVDVNNKELARRPLIKDLENISNQLLTKLSTFTVVCHKRFAEKQEVEKNIKFLDSQLRHVIEHYVRRHEKGKDSMVFNKNKNEARCGSCDSNVQGLGNDYYLPWNQISAREDKLYRGGNGFSRLLNMVDFEGQVRYDSDSAKARKKLPKLNRSLSEFMKKTEEEAVYDDADGPKMCIIN